MSVSFLSYSVSLDVFYFSFLCVHICINPATSDHGHVFLLNLSASWDVCWDGGSLDMLLTTAAHQDCLSGYLTEVPSLTTALYAGQCLV